MYSYGTDRIGDVISVWTTDLRRSPRKIAEASKSIRPGERLVDYPHPHDRPGRPTRFRIVTEEA